MSEEPDMSTAIDVVLITGHGRSGSTLLARLLGRREGAFSAGEIHSMWRWAGRENRLCGCGAPFRECPFWWEVTGRTFSSRREEGMARAYELWNAVARPRHLGRLIYPLLRSAAYSESLRRYRDLLASVYRAVLEISGASWIVDSSKSPLHGLILAEMPAVRTAAVHLIRDSRGVAYSNQRRKRNPAVYWTRALMDRRTPLRTSATWITYNALSAVVLRRTSVSARVRYEDLALDPRGVLGRLANRLSLSGDDSGTTPTEGSVRLGTNHMVSGNPMRFSEGNLKIELDDAWRSEMGHGSKLLVTWLTWPMLRTYGYV